MQQAAICASRTLRSALDTKILPGSPWSPSTSFGPSILGATLKNHEEPPSLSTRLSQRLVSAGTTGVTAPQQSGTRALSTRAKRKRAEKLEAQKAEANAKLKGNQLPGSSSTAEPQWTAVGAALSTLEESIARTNLLLQSLASSEARTRRMRSPRLSWEQKSTLDLTGKKKQSTPTHAVRALAALLQELGEKQAVAATLLSRLNESPKPVPMAPPPSNAAFEDVFAAGITSGVENNDLGVRSAFESGWGTNELVPRSMSGSTSPGDSEPQLIQDKQPVVDPLIETISGKVDSHAISLDSIARDAEHYVPIPTLKHGLDRVLFNPGVHWLQDPNSRVYNFPPELQTMPAFTSFAYDRVTTFITSSKDTELADLARRHGKRFVGSTSSVSMILAHIYFLVSGWRELDLEVLSGAFSHMPKDFSAGQKMPYTFFMRQKDGIAAFDSGSQSEDPLEQNVLSYIGIMLEKLLTLPKDDFEALLRHAPGELVENSHPLRREAYRYSMSKSMVLRSQLDCVDGRLPGTGVFDLKTRAAISVRRDVWNLEVGSGYQIRSATGPLESFEREYYDLCRSAFLKYSFQARIGAMDGVFVAYHNTSRMFGFQYVPLKEMDQRLFGSHEGGERVFKSCLGLLEVIAENVVSCFPGQEIKAMICTSESKDPELSIWVEPANWESPSSIPVHEIRLKISHQINGEHVPVGAQVTFEQEDWKINYNVVRLLPSAETRARRDKVFARQQAIRVTSLPEGTTIEEFSNRMKDGVLEGYAPRSDDVESVTSGEDAESPTAPPSLKEWNKRFRTQTTPLVHNLRELSRKGLEDLDRWSQDASPKVVYKPRV